MPAVTPAGNQGDFGRFDEEGDDDFIEDGSEVDSDENEDEEVDNEEIKVDNFEMSE